MASPVNTGIPPETKARVAWFAEELRARLLPYESTYRYKAHLRLLDHDQIPKSPEKIEEEGLGLADSRQAAGLDTLLQQANRSFQKWRQLSIDLLADKDSQSESIIHDETARLRKEIEARAIKRALTVEGSSSSESTKPDTSWLDLCMTHRNAWRPPSASCRRISELPSPAVCQTNEPDSVSSEPPSIRHPLRAPFTPINGQFRTANHGGFPRKRQ